MTRFRFFLQNHEFGKLGFKGSRLHLFIKTKFNLLQMGGSKNHGDDLESRSEFILELVKILEKPFIFNSLGGILKYFVKTTLCIQTNCF